MLEALKMSARVRWGRKWEAEREKEERRVLVIPLMGG